jgi:hypothetical protein
MQILKRLFARPKVQRSSTDFATTYARYQDACCRGDTRAQKEAWQPLKDARTAQLKAEREAAELAAILNRAIGWRGAR